MWRGVVVATASAWKSSTTTLQPSTASTSNALSWHCGSARDAARRARANNSALGTLCWRPGRGPDSVWTMVA
eukprot:15061333-Alexandrium_andersonii.AAC.1